MKNAKIQLLVTFKSHFKKFDDFQYTKIKFLLTFKAKNEIFIVDFFGNLGPLWKGKFKFCDFQGVPNVSWTWWARPRLRESPIWGSLRDTNVDCRREVALVKSFELIFIPEEYLMVKLWPSPPQSF